MRKDPALRERMMILASAENGEDAKSSGGRQSTVEAAMNRASARGTTLREVIEDRAYYAPYKDGGYERHQRLLQNPEYRKQVENEVADAVKGSNKSNYATHEGSAGVAANARRNQTVTATADSGQQFSRKDVNSPESIREHGAGTVRMEGDWYKKTKAAEEAARAAEVAKKTASAAAKTATDASTKPVNASASASAAIKPVDAAPPPAPTPPAPQAEPQKQRTDSSIPAQTHDAMGSPQPAEEPMPNVEPAKKESNPAVTSDTALSDGP
jgi:hypothetical protein